LRQEQINTLLVKLTSQGKQVVSHRCLRRVELRVHCAHAPRPHAMLPVCHRPSGWRKPAEVTTAYYFRCAQ